MIYYINIIERKRNTCESFDKSLKLKQRERGKENITDIFRKKGWVLSFD